MKTITIIRLVLAIGILPAAVAAQPKTNEMPCGEPANYFAEFADLMHGEMGTVLAPVPYVNIFPAFVHFREEMKGKAEDFPAYYKNKVALSVPLAKTVFADWAAYMECKDKPAEDCSGR
ncbi:MAG TPA: hypothetical protein ENJ95_10560 [Bacteroidetes bacterium]|nr:hypothetical protein [Bacteroidota bacterium]